MPPDYWTWDSRRRDHYHAEKTPAGEWHYTWYSSFSSPGAQQQPVQSPASNVPRAPFVTQPGGQARPQLGGLGSPYHAYSAPLTASTAHSPPTAFRAAPCAYPSPRARTVETILPPTHPSASAQAAHQPWLVQPRDPYDATTPLTLPGSGYISAGQSIAQNASDRGKRYGQSPETGTARLVQAPSQSVSHRTGNQVTSGSDQSVLVTARDEASTPRPRNQIPRLMSDETRLDPRQGATYPRRTSSVTVQTSAGRGSGRSTKYYNPQSRRDSLGHPSQARTTTQPEHVQVSSITSSAAGKKRSQPDPHHALSLSEDEEDHADQVLAKAMEDSRITYAQEKYGGGSSFPQNGGPTHALVKPSLAESVPASLLDPKEFKHIRYKTHRFFVVGKVFMIFYIENAGATSEANQLAGPSFTTVAHGEQAHHQFRRFVVVKEVSKEHYCYCCPITTYGSRGAAKPGVDQTVHTIAYTGDVVPPKLPGETNMRKDPIRIIPVSLAEKLDPRSRINIGKIYPINHNIKVKDIGQVDEKSLPKLLGYRRIIRDGG